MHMANTGFYQTDCESILSQIKHQEKQIRLKRRWLLGLPASKAKQKQFEGPKFLKYRSLPESLLREDDMFYETIKACIEEAFGACNAEGNVMQDEMKLFGTRNITRTIMSCLDDFTNKGLYLLAMVLTGGSAKFEKTRSRMKKVIRDHLPKVLESRNHNHHQMEICRELSRLLFDPQNFRAKCVTFLTSRFQSHHAAVTKVLCELQNLPCVILIAMYRKLKSAQASKPQLVSRRHGWRRDYLIKKVRKASEKMLSELAEGDELQEPLAKAMAIPGLLLKLTPGFQNSSVTEFYPFSSEIKSLQNEIAKAIWSLKTKIRLPVLKKLQLLLDPIAKVSNRSLRAGIRKMLTEYLFECSEMDAIPKSLLEALAIINSNSRSTPLGCFRKEEVEEEVECILSVSAHTKQILLDLLPDHDFDQDFADAYMEELEESDNGVDDSDDDGWLQEDRSSQSSRSHYIDSDYQEESTGDLIPFDFKPPTPTTKENGSSSLLTPQKSLDSDSVGGLEPKHFTEMDSVARHGIISSSPFLESRFISSVVHMDMNQIKVEGIGGFSVPKTNGNSFPSPVSANRRFERREPECNSGVDPANSPPFISSNFSCGAQGNPCHQFPNQKVASNQGPSKVTSQIDRRKPSTMRFPDRFVGLDSFSKAVGAGEVHGGSKTEVEVDRRVDVGRGKEGVEVPKSNAAKSSKPGSSKNGSRKRRKSAVESSESYEGGSSDVNDKGVSIHKYGSNPSGKNSGNHRRSSRQKQNVSYQKNINNDDDDFVNPPKRGCRSFSVSDEEIKEAAVDGGVCNDENSAPYAAEDRHRKEVKQKESAPEESLLNKKSKTGEYDMEREKVANSDHDDRKKSKADDMPEAISVISIEVPDPEFSDFETCKKENCFAVNQTWAMYDPIDGMPRFYARVKKVVSPGFKLHFTWLEADPDDPGEIDWLNADLPIACGKYRLDATEETVDCLMFSHQMQCIKGSGRVSYLIYPRKGETWALFKDWDIRWSSDPEKHLSFKFEFVEVLSDFVEDVGIKVAYLGKLKGFVSLFQRTEQNGTVSFQVPANELYRFSHRIPSFRMTGEEKVGVPKGSFELDPASLPTDLDKYDDPGVVKMENGHMDSDFSGLYCKSSENKVEHVMGSDIDHIAKKHDGIEPERETSMLKSSSRQSNGTHTNHDASGCIAKEGASKENSYCDLPQPKGMATSCQADKDINTPKKFKTPNKQEKQDIERQSLNLRRSPRNLCKKNSQVNELQSMNEEGTVKHSDDDKEENHCSFTKSKGSVSCQFDKKMHLGLKYHSSNSFAKSPGVSPPMTSGCKISEAELNDFNGQKSEDNFQLDQIWAIYSERDGLPKIYAQVKKIESTPEFKLHVALLKPSSLPKDTSQSVCCGLFKVKNGKTKVLSRSAFSHRLRAESIGENIYKIHPRKGEVWALYKNLNLKVTCSDMRKGECDIVEVLEDNDQSTEIVVLSPVSGFTSVFKSPRIQRSKSGIIGIPHVEIARFSHQIPAFQHSGEKDSSLMGCWELDPVAVPRVIICLE